MDDIENSRSTISQLGLSVAATTASQVGGLWRTEGKGDLGGRRRTGRIPVTFSVRWILVCCLASTPPSWRRELPQIQSHDLVKRINREYLWGIFSARLKFFFQEKAGG
jgi:hypothetical protein